MRGRLRLLGKRLGTHRFQRAGMAIGPHDFQTIYGRSPHAGSDAYPGAFQWLRPVAMRHKGYTEINRSLFRGFWYYERQPVVSSTYGGTSMTSLQLRWGHRVLSVVFVLFVLSALAVAQDYRGKVQGVVSDTSNAALAGASV